MNIPFCCLQVCCYVKVCKYKSCMTIKIILNSYDRETDIICRVSYFCFM